MSRSLTTPTGVGPWLRRYETCDDPAFRLICLSYAGSGASVFRDWRLPSALRAETWAVQLPGRENRYDEEPARDIAPVVEALVAAVTGLTPRLPYAFFGHSMGALLAFETTRELRRRGQPLPGRLFLSAYRAADLPPRREAVSTLPDDRFLARLREMAGDSPSAVHDPELLLLLAPKIRADFALCETYRHRPEPALDVPITGFVALDDPEVAPDEVAAWWRHTSIDNVLHTYHGGHLFIRDHATDVLAVVADELSADAR